MEKNYLKLLFLKIQLIIINIYYKHEILLKKYNKINKWII